MLFWSFELGSLYIGPSVLELTVDQAGLEHKLLLLPPKCQDYKLVPPCSPISEDRKSQILNQEDREGLESPTNLLIVNMSTAGGSSDLVSKF